MTTLLLQSFGGMLPRYGEELVPDNAASYCRNCRLISGELQALKQPVPIKSFTAWQEVITRVFRVQVEDGGFYAVFADDTVDFVKAPIINDSWNRHYWTSFVDVPRYAPADALRDAFSAHEIPVGLRLGIPAPVGPLTVVAGAPVPPDTSDPLLDTRVYVYTFYSKYGEEGAPSPPVIATGPVSADWVVTGFDTVEPPPANEREIDRIKLYRTITGTLGNTQYYLVETLPLGTATYTDNKSSEDIALAPLLGSNGWNEPPPTLKGVIVHPNGFLVGFSGRDLFFSVPYHPHAWPVEYIVSMRWNIVGLGIVGQSVVVLTEGAPQVAAGVRPEAMSLVKSDTPDPCLSRRGIVSTSEGVFYPGANGLMLAVASGDIVNTTQKFLSRREWNLQYRPYALQAVKNDSQYVAFYSSERGFAIDFEEANQAFVPLVSPDWAHSAFQGDPVSGRVWMLRDNVLHVWNPDSGPPVTYLWRSKEFVAATPANYGAYKITYKDVTATGLFDPQIRAQMLAFNVARIKQPLNPLNFAALNEVHVVDLGAPVVWTVDRAIEMPPQHKVGLHHGPLMSVFAPNVGTDLIFRIYIEREFAPYYTQVVTDMECYRPDTGFRAILWKFELEGTADVQTVKVAETPKELSTL